MAEIQAHLPIELRFFDRRKLPFPQRESEKQNFNFLQEIANISTVLSIFKYRRNK